MSAIFKRELKSYFTSPIGYAVLAMILFLAGDAFHMIMYYGVADLSYVYSNMLTLVLLLVLPILTMRLLSDDKRQKTDQALLTAPVSLSGIVVGKYLAALLLFVIGISVTLVFAIVLAASGAEVNWLQTIGNYLGLLMLGGMVITIGLLISSLTENQFIAALGTFLVGYSMLMIDSLASMTSNTLVIAMVNFLSVSARYTNFTTGVIRYDDIVFFISLQALFLFLTVRIMDRKRWN